MAKICFSQINACNDFKTRLRGDDFLTLTSKWVGGRGDFFIWILSCVCFVIKANLVNLCRNEASLLVVSFIFTKTNGDGCGRNAFTK